MDPDRWQRVAHVYQSALEREPGERGAFLATACAGDDELRREVESLLAYDGAPVLIDRPMLEAAAAVLDDRPDLRPGTQVGPYRIDRLLGTGGMGHVYHATDTTLQRRVALKFLPGHLATNPNRVSRLRREAQLLAALNHPNIAQIYGLEEYESTYCIAMELVDGETLADRVRRGPLPVDEALRIAKDIAEALETAHEKGIVHRDLKPANVMVTLEGQVKVLDFGLAKAVEPLAGSADDAPVAPTITSPTMTRMGVILGTAAYMSPEQAKGRAADKRSDVWAFGCVLYELLTGKRAFEANDVSDTLAFVISKEPDWSALPERTAPSIRRLIVRCLQKDRRHRLRDIGDARIEIEEASGELELAAEGDGARKPWITSLGMPALALIILALIAAVGGLGFIAGSRRSTPSSSRATRLTFDRGTIRAARFAPDGKTVVFGASWGGQPIKIFQTRVGSPESTPLQLPDAEVLAVSSAGELAISVGHRFRGWIGQGTLARAPLVGGSFREVLDTVRAADWSPDGSELAIVRRVNDRDRLEYPIGTVLYETPGYISHPRISPSGDVVAYHDHPVFGDDRGWVSIVTRNGERRTLTREWGTEEGLAWSRDGGEIWFGAGEAGRKIVYGVRRNGELRQIWAGPADLTVLDIGRDGQLLATTNTIRTEITWTPADESQERDVSWHAWSFAKDVTRDGKMILLSRFDEGAGLDYQVGLRRLDAPTAIVLGQGVPSLFSPDSKWIVGVTFSQPSLFVLPTGAGEPRTLTRSGFRYITAGWFPDGKRVIFAARENHSEPSAYVQDLGGAAPVRISAPIPPLLADWGLRVSPDGSWFFGAQAAGPPVIVPVSGGQPRVLSELGDDDLPVAWTPDGRGILIVKRSSDHMSAGIVRFDHSTGRIEPARQVNVADKSGGRGLTCIATPDGLTVVCNVARYLTDLYQIEGLR